LGADMTGCPWDPGVSPKPALKSKLICSNFESSRIHLGKFL
jgi:hypothetical protein